MKLVYNVEDRPKFGQLLLFALQQLLAIITATIVVPVVVNAKFGQPVLNSAAALVGAGFGTITYLLFTKRKSPVFLGSSFAFIDPLVTGCAFGYFGIVLGAIFAGIVYVLIAIIVKYAGVKWVNKIMPPVVIGPTVALIGLSLAGNAVGDLVKANATNMSYNLVAILVGLITLLIIVICSVKGTKGMKLVPFVIGIVGGYIVASLFTVIGSIAKVDYLKIVDYSALVECFKPFKFSSIFSIPDFTFVLGIKEGFSKLTAGGVATIALAFVPVAFVVFAEHIADHKNISSIIERDLLVEPGLHRTLLGDGVGSVVGSLFGGCPNTTYGESIGCVAITGNASVATIFGAAVLAIILAFFSPVIAFINTIPSCVMGGVCMALYGFIAVSGLSMLSKVDLGESKNLFVVSAILIAGIGGLSLKFGPVVISPIATALIIGIIINIILKPSKQDGGSALSAPAANVEAATATGDKLLVNKTEEDK